MRNKILMLCVISLLLSSCKNANSDNKEKTFWGYLLPATKIQTVNFNIEQIDYKDGLPYLFIADMDNNVFYVTLNQTLSATAFQYSGIYDDRKIIIIGNWYHGSDFIDKIMNKTISIDNPVANVGFFVDGNKITENVNLFWREGDMGAEY